MDAIRFIYLLLLALQHVTLDRLIHAHSNIRYKHYTRQSTVTLENVTEYDHYKRCEHNKNDDRRCYISILLTTKRYL